LIVTLEQLTGQNRIIDSIMASLEKGQLVSAHVYGPSGSGKSWLTQALTDIITSRDGCVIRLQGECERSSEAYYPLNVFIEQKNKTGKRGLKAAKKLIAEIPVLGGAAESFLEDINLQSFAGAHPDFNAYGLNRHKAFATHVVSQLDKYSTLALVCDDAQDFDRHTLTYLDNLVKYLNTQAFESQVLLLLAFNDEAASQKATWLSSRHLHYTLGRIERGQLTQTLVLLGLQQMLPESELDVIYSSTGGHLHVLRTVVAYLNKNHEKNILQSSGRQLLHHMLEQRLQQFQQYYQLIKELLQALGGIGRSGSKTELLCVLDKNEEFPEAIHKAETLELITIENGYLRFAHDLVKEYMSGQENRRKPSFYRKFADCLRALNPSNYLRRAWAEEHAGDANKADVFRALFIIQRLRQGLNEEANELNSLFTSAEAEHLTHMVSLFGEAYQHTANGRLYEALLSLSMLPYDLPQELLAEKTYLECEVLLKHTDYPSRQEALHKLESWHILKEEEPEQWYRFSQLRLLAHAELGNFELAAKVEQEIAIFFTRRSSYDSNARDILTRLNLFSEIVYSPDIAHIKLSQTHHHLKREIEAERYDKLLDYYISLCNLSGNCISTNRLDQGLEYGKQALLLIKEFPQVYFPHKEVAINNLLLASHFKQAESTEAILRAYQNILDDELEEDRILIHTNCAGILISDGRSQEAAALLKSYEHLMEAGYTDAFYLYHHRFNYALALYLTENKTQAMAIMTALKTLSGQINAKLTPFYTRHYELALNLMEQEGTMTYTELCHRFEQAVPRYLNVCWERFKRVYLFTDLQIWTNN